jgi:hypothetical protein
VKRLSPHEGWSTYSLLECGDFLVGHGITLGNDWDQVDLVVQSLHELDIKSLERVASGCNEVQASIDTGVGDLAAIDTVLLLQIGVEAALDRSQNGLPANVSKGGGRCGKEKKEMG